jgi:hypothetical protein
MHLLQNPILKKKLVFFLFIGLLSSLTASAQTAYRHIATTANTSGHTTTLDHPQLNGNPNAIIFVMPDYNASGGDYRGNACVQYNTAQGRWMIASQSEADKINPKMSFNVLFVPKETDKIFVHQCVNENTGGSGGTFPNATHINHPATTDKPNTLLLLTQRKTAKPNNNAQTVSYAGNRWFISNAANSASDSYAPERNMPVGAAFNVMAFEQGQVPAFPNALGFMHTATPANARAINQTYLDNPAYTHSTNALVFATNNWGWGYSTTPGQTSGPENASPLAVWFNSNFANGTAIYNTKAGVNISERTKFNVVVVRGATTQDQSTTIRLNDIDEWLCPKDVLRGDREFDGHGPRIKCEVSVSIEDDGKALYAYIYFWAQETQHDWSTTERRWRKKVYDAPFGKTITAIHSDRASRTQFISPRGGSDIGFPIGDVSAALNSFLDGVGGSISAAVLASFGIPPGETIAFAKLISGYTNYGDTVVKIPPVEGALVRFFHIVGDTGSADISDDDNCNADTRIVKLEFNPVSVTLR